MSQSARDRLRSALLELLYQHRVEAVIVPQKSKWDLVPKWMLKCSCGWKSEPFPYSKLPNYSAADDHFLEVYTERLLPEIERSYEAATQAVSA
jgi:hypothetical protein